MPKMHSPSGAITSASWNGQTFEPVDGLFEVPQEAVADLGAHGLVLVPEQPDQPDQPTTPLSQWRNDQLKAKAAELGLDLAEDIKRPELIQRVSEALKAQQVGQ